MSDGKILISSIKCHVVLGCKVAYFFAIEEECALSDVQNVTLKGFVKQIFEEQCNNLHV